MAISSRLSHVTPFIPFVHPLDLTQLGSSRMVPIQSEVRVPVVVPTALVATQPSTVYVAGRAMPVAEFYAAAYQAAVAQVQAVEAVAAVARNN